MKRIVRLLNDTADSGRARRRLLAILAAGLLLPAAILVGCSGDEPDADRTATDSPPASKTADGSDEAPVASMSGGEHVHGLGVNPAGGEIMIATHGGLWEVAPGATEAEPAGDSRDDLMGFTVVGPDRFLSSGHPGPDSDLPPLLGLQRSVDGGSSWQSVSLLGEADLHVLRASGDRIYGVDSATARFLTSADGGDSWEAREVPGQVIDLAVAPGDALRLVASTDSGLYGSGDGGKSWDPLAEEGLGLLTWPANGRLLMVDASGKVMASADRGETFAKAGSIGSTPEAFSSGGGRVLASVDGGRILVSDDGGRDWTIAVEPQG